MKFAIFLTLIIIGAQASDSIFAIVSDEALMKELWSAWKMQYGVSYPHSRRRNSQIWCFC